jgi:hypothetical protein
MNWFLERCLLLEQAFIHLWGELYLGGGPPDAGRGATKTAVYVAPSPSVTRPLFLWDRTRLYSRAFITGLRRRPRPARDEIPSAGCKS